MQFHWFQYCELSGLIGDILFSFLLGALNLLRGLPRIARRLVWVLLHRESEWFTSGLYRFDGCWMTVWGQRHIETYGFCILFDICSNWWSAEEGHVSWIICSLVSAGYCCGLTYWVEFYMKIAGWYQKEFRQMDTGLLF